MHLRPSQVAYYYYYCYIYYYYLRQQDYVLILCLFISRLKKLYTNLMNFWRGGLRD